MKNKLKKICVVFFVVMLVISTIYATTVNATTVTEIIANMKEASNPDAIANPGETGIGKVINIIIGLLQIAGTGISVIVVTMLGIKYILASVEEKAEIKKQAVPIVIGCILVFGAVNLMAAVEEFSRSTLISE